MFRYDILILDRAAHRFITRIVSADSFALAASMFIVKERKMIEKHLVFYCRKLRFQDLLYMGQYDSDSLASSIDGSHSHLLYLSNGQTYEYDGEEFRKVFVSAISHIEMWGKACFIVLSHE